MIHFSLAMLWGSKNWENVNIVFIWNFLYAFKMRGWFVLQTAVIIFQYNCSPGFNSNTYKHFMLCTLHKYLVMFKSCDKYAWYDFSLWYFIKPLWTAIFFNCYLAVPGPTLGHSWGDSLTNLMLITVSVLFWPEGHQEPFNQVGSLSPVECLVEFWPGTFQF